MPFLGTTGGASVKQYGGQANLGYFIKNSLRFRSSASAYLNRTFSTPTNNIKWTWSGWVKRGTIGGSVVLFWAGANTDGGLYFFNDTITLQLANTTVRTSAALLRDPAAWYHIVCVLDTANATADDRAVLYINGVRASLTTNTTITINSTYNINSNAVVHGLARFGTTASNYFDGYLTEVNFIDGQALTPSSFGKTDAATGQWIPKKFASTYGTNGFYLKFADASAATAAAIGKDSSPNGNNWTPNNISVTAGATYDAMIDSPTLSAVASNFAVQNPLYPGSVSLINGNLQSTAPTTTVVSSASSYQVSSGKWYWEVTVTAINGTFNYPFIGAYRSIPNTLTGSYRPGGDVNGFSYRQNGAVYADTAQVATYGSMGTDVIGIALDLTNLQVLFYKNGTLQGTVTGLVAGTYIPADSEYNGSGVAYNYGQQPFTYTPPSGFKSLNTFNLP